MILYHYCSNAAFVSMMSSKEIWASDLVLSNDLLEGRWIREIFSKICDDRQIVPNHKTQLLKHFDYLIEVCGGAGFCMSEEGDLLSQWRGYADNGAGVSIGFNKAYFEALGSLKRDRNDDFNASLQKVIYDVAAQKELISPHANEIIELALAGALSHASLMILESGEEKELRKKNYSHLSLRFLFFVFNLYSLKNPAFSEEREWRILSFVIRREKSEGWGASDSMEFRALSDRIIPYRRIPIERLDYPPMIEIILGTRNITPEHVVESLLARHGFTEVSVKRSKASYR